VLQRLVLQPPVLQRLVVQPPVPWWVLQPPVRPTLRLAVSSPEPESAPLALLVLHCCMHTARPSPSSPRTTQHRADD
jgi:hypothetical protein